MRNIVGVVHVERGRLTMLHHDFNSETTACDASFREAASLTCARLLLGWLLAQGLGVKRCEDAILCVLPELRHAAGRGGRVAVELTPRGVRAFSSNGLGEVADFVRAAEGEGHAVLVFNVAGMAVAAMHRTGAADAHRVH
jgi:hypothetical protein